MMLGAHPMWMSSASSSAPPAPTPDTWIQGSIPGSTLPRRLKYNGSNFVVTGGDPGYVMTSASGAVFDKTGVSGPGGTTRYYAYSGSRHILGRSGNSIYSSPNFSSWTSRSITSATLTYIHWSDVFNMFMAVGDSGAFRYSMDGDTWFNGGSIMSGANLFKVASGNGYSVISGNGSQAYTTDGTSWTNFSLPFVASGHRTVTFNNGMFVIVDQGGEVATCTVPTSWTVRTPLNSTTVDVGTVNNVQDIHMDSMGVLVLVGTKTATSRGIYVTTNFTSYQSKSSSLPAGQIESVTKGGNTWVVTGDTAGDYIAYSTVI